MKVELDKKEQVLQDLTYNENSALTISDQLLSVTEVLRDTFQSIERFKKDYDGTNGTTDSDKSAKLNSMLYSVDGAQCLLRGLSLRAHEVYNGLNKLETSVSTNLRVVEEEGEKNDVKLPPVQVTTDGVVPVDIGTQATEATPTEVVSEPEKTEDTKSDPRIDAIMKSLKPGQSVEITANATGIKHKITETHK